MTNLSSQTRKDQVFHYLKTRLNSWVDGTELANEQVGGSEGLKRLRELRQDLKDSDWEIEMRGHPDPDRSIYQYRLVQRVTTRSVYAAPAAAAPMQVADLGHLPGIPQEGPRESPRAPDRRSTHLAYDPTTDTYIAVSDHPAPDEPPEPVVQTDLGVPEVEGGKYLSMPTRLELGMSIFCPMCHGIHKAIKSKATKQILGYEEFTRDPNHPTRTCPRCNGFGLIPNG